MAAGKEIYILISTVFFADLEQGTEDLSLSPACTQPEEPRAVLVVS